MVCLALGGWAVAQQPAVPVDKGGRFVLQRSAVPFMYPASQEVYRAYGATILCWGGGADKAAVARAHEVGVTYFASVGMVTEFSRYYERFPDSYEVALCRDVDGKPLKVPWLTDHQHKGIPYWWCCTNQPQFRQYLEERVAATAAAGVDGLHIDDHLGTAGCVSIGGCFCDRCVTAFREYLQALPKAQRQTLKLGDLTVFDYRQHILNWQAAQGGAQTKPWQRPLWNEWQSFHLKAAAAFMQELKQHAAKVAGRPLPMGANAGILWYPHLVDYQALDIFVAEIDHQGESERFSTTPLFAYRLAEAMGRPLAATASGGDWAFVKEHELDGLVRSWIAQAYAAGQYLMAPHHQWCYTPQKGTHWYEGPQESYAPLYRFVRDHADLFDGYQTLAEVGLVYSFGGVRRDRTPLMKAVDLLVAANVSFRMVVAGDDLLDHPLPPDELALPALIAVEPLSLTPEDQALLDSEAAKGRVYSTVDAALADIKSAASVQDAAGIALSDRVHVFPRLKPGAPAVVHLINWDYDRQADDVRPARDLRLVVRPEALRLKSVSEATLFAPGADPQRLQVQGNTITVPNLGLWGVLRLS